VWYARLLAGEEPLPPNGDRFTVAAAVQAAVLAEAQVVAAATPLPASRVATRATAVQVAAEPEVEAQLVATATPLPGSRVATRAAAVQVGVEPEAAARVVTTATPLADSRTEDTGGEEGEETGEEEEGGVVSHVAGYDLHLSKKNPTGYENVIPRNANGRVSAGYSVRVQNSVFDCHASGFDTLVGAALWYAKLVAGHNPPLPQKKAASPAASSAGAGSSAGGKAVPGRGCRAGATSAGAGSSAGGKAPPRRRNGAGTNPPASRKRPAEEEEPLPGHGFDEEGFVGAWDGALCAVAAGEPLAGDAMETEAPLPPPGLWLAADAAVAAAAGFVADAAPHAAPAGPSSVEQRMRAQYTAAHRRLVEIPVVDEAGVPVELPTVELARRVMGCAFGELHRDGLPEKLELLTEETDPAVAMARVSAGEWTSESGPMVTPASRREDFVGLGLVVPPWTDLDSVLWAEGQGDLRLKKRMQLNVSDLRGGFNGRRNADWIFKQFDVPPEDRTCLLNCVHPAASNEVQGCSGNTDALAQMPTALRGANISRRWWPTPPVFLLFSMQGTSMGYHLDLWATAVFYFVLWGQKMFVVAPPTPSNLRAFQAWQQSDERAGVGEFPAKLEGAKLLTLTQGQSLMLPSGWIHAVFTPEDSCVLGWNWQPKEQLPAMLSVVRADWGPKTEEMRQLKAFKFEELVRKLWDVLAEEVASLHEACHRPYGEEEAHDVGPIQRNVLGVLVSFLHPRTGMASRGFRYPGGPGLLSVAARLVVGGPEAWAVERCYAAWRRARV